MAKRPVTNGNVQVDYTKIRGDLKELPAGIRQSLRNVVPANGRSPTTADLPNDQQYIDVFKLNKLSNIISNNINAVTDLRAITPYIDKAALIWKTILLTPNGKQDKILTYDTQPSHYKSTALYSELETIWANYFTTDYKIEEELPDWVEDIWFNTGSVALFNLSRPGLDYLINGNETLDDKDGRNGNESYRLFQARSKEELEKEFVKEGGKYKARNKGLFVRDPSKKDQFSRVNGLESLLGSTSNYSELEFPLFEADTEGDPFKITLTDNPAILYMQRFNEVVRQTEISEVVGAESFDSIISRAIQGEKAKTSKRDDDDKQATTSNLTDEQISNITKEIYRHRNPSPQNIQFVKPNDSLSVAPYGRGITFHVPSGAVIPIHFNGRVKEKTDFILLLDDDGNFLNDTINDEVYQSVTKTKDNIQTKNSNGSDNQLIANLRKVQLGQQCDFDMTEFGALANQAIIKRFMAAVLSNRGENISITIDEAAQKIFLSRMFKGQGIRCLYVPGESITYMAIKYNRLGVGQSLTNLAKTHIARLAALELADALANLEAAQPHTQMTIRVKEGDPNPANSIAIARASYFQSNPRLHNLLSTAQLSLPSIVDALRESSLTIKVDASENPDLPTPEIDMQPYEKNNFKRVEPGSIETLKNQIANYLVLPKSWLDISDDQNNFKIEAVTENDMVFRQAGMWQDIFCDHIIDFERKHARVNGELLNRLINCILNNEKLWTPDSKEQLPGETKESKVKFILTNFINSIYCFLPTPTSAENTNRLKERLQAAKDLTDAWMEMSGNEKIMPFIIKTLGIEVEGFSADEIKVYVNAVFLSEAFKRFNLPMPFDEIVNDGKGGGMASLVNSIVQQRTNLMEFNVLAITEIAKTDTAAIKAHKKKVLAALEKLATVSGEGGDDNDDDLVVNPSDSESSLVGETTDDDDNVDNPLEPLGTDEENNEEEEANNDDNANDNAESNNDDEEFNPFVDKP